MAASCKNRLNIPRVARSGLQAEHGLIENTDSTFHTYTGLNGNHAAIIKLLLKNGAEVNIKDNDGRTALMITAAYGDEEITNELLKHKAEVNAKKENGETTLMQAAYAGHTSIVKCLLEHKADVNLQNNYGVTALMLAANNGHTEIVRLLLKKGAYTNTLSKKEKSAHDYASSASNSNEIISLLDEYKHQ